MLRNLVTLRIGSESDLAKSPPSRVYVAVVCHVVGSVRALDIILCRNGKRSQRFGGFISSGGNVWTSTGHIGRGRKRLPNKTLTVVQGSDRGV